MGTYRTFDVGGDPETRRRLAQVLTEFVELGGQVVDSSPMYGNAESVLGDIAKQTSVQKKLFYATKVWTHGEQQGIEEMQTSMRRMRVKNMDLMQIHNLVDWKTHIKTLYQWKQQGIIRYVGITHYLSSAFDDLEHIMKSEKIDFVQLPYSIVNIDAEKRLLPLAQDRGIAIIANMPFAQGRLFRSVRGKTLPHWAADFDCKSWAQFFLKYILSHEAITCPIPATSKPKHLVDNMRAAFGRLPDKKTRKRMLDLMADIN
ncbi:aldo/keto reductase [Kaarinaea lacus]